MSLPRNDNKLNKASLDEIRKEKQLQRIEAERAKRARARQILPPTSIDLANQRIEVEDIKRLSQLDEKLAEKEKGFFKRVFGMWFDGSVNAVPLLGSFGDIKKSESTPGYFTLEIKKNVAEFRKDVGVISAVPLFIIDIAKTIANIVRFPIAKSFAYLYLPPPVGLAGGDKLNNFVRPFVSATMVNAFNALTPKQNDSGFLSGLKRLGQGLLTVAMPIVSLVKTAVLIPLAIVTAGANIAAGLIETASIGLHTAARKVDTHSAGSIDDKAAKKNETIAPITGAGQQQKYAMVPPVASVGTTMQIDALLNQGTPHNPIDILDPGVTVTLSQELDETVTFHVIGNEDTANRRPSSTSTKPNEDVLTIHLQDSTDVPDQEVRSASHQRLK